MSLCGARTRAGGACGRPAGWGTGHPGAGRCKLHGGASPNAELSGSVELARREATVMGHPLPIDPHEGILKAIAIVNGEVEYATAKIAELTEAEAAGPVVTRRERPLSLGKDGEDANHPVQEVMTGAPALNVWIRARHEALDRLVQYSAAAARAGVEERQVRLVEDQAKALALIVMTLVQRLGLDPSAVEVRAHMRAALEAARDGISRDDLAVMP